MMRTRLHVFGLVMQLAVLMGSGPVQAEPPEAWAKGLNQTVLNPASTTLVYQVLQAMGKTHQLPMKAWFVVPIERRTWLGLDGDILKKEIKLKLEFAF